VLTSESQCDRYKLRKRALVVVVVVSLVVLLVVLLVMRVGLFPGYFSVAELFQVSKTPFSHLTGIFFSTVAACLGPRRCSWFSWPTWPKQHLCLSRLVRWFVLSGFLECWWIVVIGGPGGVESTWCFSNLYSSTANTIRPGHLCWTRSSIQWWQADL